MTKRVVVCLTSRGNYATVGSVLHALNDDPAVELEIIVAGASMVEKYGTLSDMIEDDGLAVTRELYNLLESGTPESTAKTTGLSLIEFTNEISRLNPDAVITIADRYETMAVTLSASYLNVPVVHTHGGEITGSIDEKVRHATTKMADYHVVCTERSREVVKRLGEPPERVFKTGDPSMDPAAEVLEETQQYDPQTEYEGEGDDIDVTDPYLVVQYHPVHTDHTEEYGKTWTVLEGVAETGIPTFWFWPNMDAGNTEVSQAIEDFRAQRSPPGFKFFVNLHPKDYLRLVVNSACYVGNSSVAVRECSFLGQPAVNVGDRQLHRERADNVVDVAIESDAITSAIHDQVDVGSYPQSTLYGDGHAAERIRDIIVETDLTLKEPMAPELLGIDTEGDWSGTRTERELNVDR
jgi:UDP-hydrolysing UDP-N-acetyl-D-glucosamine 2-epimerase